MFYDEGFGCREVLLAPVQEIKLLLQQILTNAENKNRKWIRALQMRVILQFKYKNDAEKKWLLMIDYMEYY